MGDPVRAGDVKVGDGCAAVSSGDVIFVLWKSPASLPRWKWQLSEIEALTHEHPQGVLVVNLILASSSPPDTALRSMMREDLERLGPKLRRFIAVAIGDGVWQSLVRAIVRGVLLLGGLSKRLALAGTVHEAFDEVRRVSSSATPGRNELRDAVRSLCQALGVELLEAA
jgi:hypothetical protein